MEGRSLPHSSLPLSLSLCLQINRNQSAPAMNADSSSGGTSHVTVGDARPQGCSGPLGQGEESLARSGAVNSASVLTWSRPCPCRSPPPWRTAPPAAAVPAVRLTVSWSSAESTEDRGGLRADQTLPRFLPRTRTATPTDLGDSCSLSECGPTPNTMSLGAKGMWGRRSAWKVLVAGRVCALQGRRGARG